MDSYATAGSLPPRSQPPSLHSLHSCSDRHVGASRVACAFYPVVGNTTSSHALIRSPRRARARSGNVSGPRAPSNDGTASAPRLDRPSVYRERSRMRHTRLARGSFLPGATIGRLHFAALDETTVAPSSPPSPLGVGRARRARRRGGRATWLILPVVICLSQRLSHACVSMNYFRL